MMRERHLSICMVVMLFTCAPILFADEVFYNDTIFWNEVRQTITGFGASGGNGSASNFQRLSTANQQSLCDLFFDSTKGIGLNLVRNELYWKIEPSLGIWDWSQDNDQIWLMNEAKKRGATYFWSASWSMPAWMKTNNSITNGGFLKTQNYQDFADYLSRYVREYKSRFNLDIRAISVQNEPGPYSYQSCSWTSGWLRDFIKNNLGPTFARDNVTAKIMMPEASSWGYLAGLADSTMMDPIAREYVGILAAHQYYTSDTLLSLYSIAKKYGKEVWQTETGGIGEKPDYTMTSGIVYAKQIHNALAGAECNGWGYWVFLNSWGDNEGLADISGSNYIASKRLYGLGQFSKFVRPGFSMVNAVHNPGPGMFVTAYKHPTNGKQVIVAINGSTVPRQVSFKGGITGPKIASWITTNQHSIEFQKIITPISGEFYDTLYGSSVTTYINDTTGTGGKVPRPMILPGLRWLFSTPQTISIVNYAPNAQVYYTTNGNDLTTSSTRYTGPFNISTPSTIKARSYSQTGGGYSGIVQTSYLRALQPVNPSNLVNGFGYAYYEGAWTALPDFSKLTPVSIGTLKYLSTSPAKKNTNFGFVYSGFMSIPDTGEYVFYLTSQDGSKLYIGDTLLINNDGQHGAVEVAGTIGLCKGLYAFSIPYFKGAATGSAITLRYEGPKFSKKTFPLTDFYYQNNSGIVAEHRDNALSHNPSISRVANNCFLVDVPSNSLYAFVVNDVMGRKLFETSGKGSAQVVLPVTVLRSGVYIVTVATPGCNVSHVFVLHR